MEPVSKANLRIHPSREQGQTALLDRLAKRLVEERQIAIIAIEKAIANLQEHEPEGPPETANKLIAHFQNALNEIRAVDPAVSPDPEKFENIAGRLEQLNELPRAYLLLSKAGVLKNRAPCSEET